MNQPRKVLITGATAGIGEATARSLAAEGTALILIGRRAERLQNLKAEINANQNTEVETFALDISDRKAVDTFFSENKSLAATIDVLVNNAGLARGVDKIDQADVNDWEEMIDVNVKGLLYMTKHLLPALKENRGHIVNIGSVAGRGVYPGGAVYCASKFAVRALTEGMRMDLQGTGVRVTNISPGMVKTEFSDVRLQDSEKAKSVYSGMTPLQPHDIAECIRWSLDRPAHVNIQEMVVYPTDQASMYHVYRQEKE